jgi:lipopolysaccharide transport system ATP-binding protein
MTRSAIQVRGLAKRYTLGRAAPAGNLRELVMGWARGLTTLGRRPAAPGTDTLWALRDVDLDVAPGEALGVIGANGAGKSTLLKVLARITEPTRGRVELRGRVGSLLEVGTGFHPELSGRENIYLNGAILGMKRTEIRRKFDEIVAFSEIERFLDTPVKRYSSGMFMRLAFSIAAHLDPEILLVDEVLAVGDAKFQRACLGKMDDVANSGRTVLFVSHNMAAIRSLTRRTVCIRAGEIAWDGPTEDVTKAYMNEVTAPQDAGTLDLERHRKRTMPHPPILMRSIVVNGSKTTQPIIDAGDDLVMEVQIEVREPIQGCHFTCILKDDHGAHVTVLFSWDQGFDVDLARGHRMLTMRVVAPPLSPGRYSADLGINQSMATRSYDLLFNVPLFEVIDAKSATQWPDRPWGPLHLHDVHWETGDGSK